NGTVFAADFGAAFPARLPTGKTKVMFSSTGTGRSAFTGVYTVNVIVGPRDFSAIQPTTRRITAAPCRAFGSVCVTSPEHLRRVFGNSAINLGLIELENLRPSLAPPHFRRRDALPVRQHERVGERVLRDLILGVVGHVSRGLRQ